MTYKGTSTWPPPSPRQPLPTVDEDGQPLPAEPCAYQDGPATTEIWSNGRWLTVCEHCAAQIDAENAAPEVRV